MIDRAAIEEFVERNRTEAVELLETLGRIPAPSHQEDARAEFCRAWFEREGVGQVEIDSAKNVVCEIGPTEQGDLSVFQAHMDVVFPDTDPLPMHREGNILYAPGIGDDTANLVCLMMACRFLLEHRAELSRGILIVANSCEEGLGNLDGTKAVFARYGKRIGRFYSLDCNFGDVVNMPVGSHRYKVSIDAEGGHSYAAFGNESAVRLAAELVGRLYEVEPPAGPKTTYNVGHIEGGSTINSIPQHCELLYEYRSSSEANLAAMKDIFNGIIEEFRGRGVKVEVETLGIRPGMGDIDLTALETFTNENIELVRNWYTGEVTTTAGSTDANIPLSQGILANTIGAIRGAGAHTREEWVDLSYIPAGIGLACDLVSTCLRG